MDTQLCSLLDDLPAYAQELILQFCPLPTRIALAATGRAWRAHALLVSPHEPTPCGQCTCVHMQDVHGAAVAVEIDGGAASLQGAQLGATLNTTSSGLHAPVVMGCASGMNTPSQQSSCSYNTAPWCVVFPRKQEHFALELLQHMAQQVGGFMVHVHALDNHQQILSPY